jgi:hypothetical protein
MSVEIRRFGELTRLFKRLIDAQGELEGAQAKLEELRVYLKPEIALLRQRSDDDARRSILDPELCMRLCPRFDTRIEC